MTSQTLLECVSALLGQADVQCGSLLHQNSATHLLREEAPTGHNATIYRPLLCLVLQGAKDVSTSSNTMRIAAGQSVVVSHAVPVVSRIVEASPCAPYTALVFPLDLDLLRSLAPAIYTPAAPTASDPFSIQLCDADEQIEAAMQRYLSQCDNDVQRPLLGPITAREIHARLLLGADGENLRKLLWHDSTASRISQATSDIQNRLADNIVVTDLARNAGMSASAFFEQFKAVTGTSPLQYQKELRLLRARDMLQSSGAKVSEIGFAVGYESSAQFSREYSRKFGRSPRQDR